MPSNPDPQSILLNTASRALGEMLRSGEAVKATYFRIGSQFGFTPRVDMVDVKDFVYEGTLANMRMELDPDGKTSYAIITLDELIGNFAVGNICVLDQYRRPLVLMSLPAAGEKYRSTGTQTGNILSYYVPIVFSRSPDTLAITITVPEYNELPTIPDAADLGTPDTTQNFIYLASQFQDKLIPAIVAAHMEENDWYAYPWMQRLDDPNYGVIDGGVVGDGYEAFIGREFDGGFFTTTNPSREFDGGSFTDSQDGVEINGGEFV